MRCFVTAGETSGGTGATKQMRRRMTVQTVAIALCAALLMQCLAPAGYMAGSLDDGWPVVLCPEGLPSGFVAHRHHDESAKHAHDWSFSGHCALGGVLDVFSVESYALRYPTVPLPVGSFAPYQKSSGGQRPIKIHPARAPPLSV